MRSKWSCGFTNRLRIITQPNQRLIASGKPAIQGQLSTTEHDLEGLSFADPNGESEEKEVSTASVVSSQDVDILTNNTRLSHILAFQGVLPRHSRPDCQDMGKSVKEAMVHYVATWQSAH